jgi:hypothetical protein
VVVKLIFPVSFWDAGSDEQRLMQGLEPGTKNVMKTITGSTFRSYIAGIKITEGFGFIEKVDRDCDVYLRLT